MLLPFFIGFWNGTSAHKRQPRVQGKHAMAHESNSYLCHCNFHFLYVWSLLFKFYLQILLLLLVWFGLVYVYKSLTISVCLQYTIAMMGYGPEDKTAVLELTYNYGVTEYDKGNAYAQVKSKFCIYRER